MLIQAMEQRRETNENLHTPFPSYNKYLMFNIYQSVKVNTLVLFDSPPILVNDMAK